MHNTQIGIFLIGWTQPREEEIRQWLDFIGAVNYDPQLSTKTGAEAITELAGRRCYMAFEPGLNPNVTKLRKDIADYITNILESGHGSVLEHATYNFAIENVSRVFTGEMNRHRAGWAISEGSMRYIRYDDMPFRMPPMFEDLDTDSELLRGLKVETRKVFFKAFQQMEDNNRALIHLWKLDDPNMELLKEVCALQNLNDTQPCAFTYKKLLTSAIRRIIGMGVSTGGIWTGNIRAIRHVLGMRVDVAAEEEICYVWTNILYRISKLEPNLIGDWELTADGFAKPKYWKV